jgi:hypothetical protein
MLIPSVYAITRQTRTDTIHKFTNGDKACFLKAEAKIAEQLRDVKDIVADAEALKDHLPDS